MNISLPLTGRRRALIVVDVQPDLMAEKARKLVPSMANFIERTEYNLYVSVTWSADETSTFFLQSRDLISREKLGATAREITTALAVKEAPLIRFHKTTRSAFKSAEHRTLAADIRNQGIEEVHLFGVDINDCVLATAYDSADYGFYTYVIEELSHHSEGIEELKEAAIVVLRRQNMTNNSLLDDTPRTELWIES